MIRRPPRSTLFPTRRSSDLRCPVGGRRGYGPTHSQSPQKHLMGVPDLALYELSPFHDAAADRKSTRLNSSHTVISYAVFCLKKKKKHKINSISKQSSNDINE